MNNEQFKMKNVGAFLFGETEQKLRSLFILHSPSLIGFSMEVF